MFKPSLLYTGTNYHPHDWSEEEWIRDLDRMQQAGFTFIRLGHLCWDSFEPREGVFTFDWMDRVFSLCAERGIGVFLDIPTRPAPTWLHLKYPSIDIVTKEGIRCNANTRYMEDVGDPFFQKYAYRLASTLSSRYKDHPALLGFGLCNELGSGYHSYSETARVRFTKWLEKKYGSIDALNEAWAAKRWSRKEAAFSAICFPENALGKGAPERYLDMKRFFSDEILAYQKGLAETIKNMAPQALTSCNHWAENPGVGYDYPKTYRYVMDYPGQGFYPGTNPELEEGFLGACFCSDYRCGELKKPIWDLEFQTGGFGDYSCPPGAMRMYTYLSYIYRAQVVCAWTYRTMLGGEEQYVFGLVDHDGSVTFKWEEFARISREAQVLNQLQLFPRIPSPRIAIAYSYESLLVSDYGKDYYSTPYTRQIMETYKTLFHMNLDCNIVDLRQVDTSYDVVLIPGHCVMDPASKKTVDRLLKEHTTVIMTAFSAKVDEHNQAFSTPLPGLLSEEFGIRVKGFDRSRTHNPSVNAGGLEKEAIDVARRDVTLHLEDKETGIPVNYHEFLEPVTARVLGYYEDTPWERPCAVSCTEYRGGKAIYLGVPASEDVLKVLLPDLLAEKGIFPRYPEEAGIVLRDLGEEHRIYVNTNPHAVTLHLEKEGHSVFSQETYCGTLKLEGYGVEILSFQ
ncbi:MAG: beta-galactosidase [Lachnospiraceae bacterium]|nr:beta-galactosidase [Lachnospiraceae bacterium]